MLDSLQLDQATVSAAIGALTAITVEAMRLWRDRRLRESGRRRTRRGDWRRDHRGDQE